MEYLETVWSWLTSGGARMYLKAALILVVGYLLARLLRRWLLRKQLNAQLEPQGVQHERAAGVHQLPPRELVLVALPRQVVGQVQALGRDR